MVGLVGIPDCTFECGTLVTHSGTGYLCYLLFLTFHEEQAGEEQERQH